MTSAVASERWAHVVGQDRAVVQLQRAAERPVHAYLLVGPRGSGIEEAARCFAAALVAPDGDDRSWDLVLRGVHPDVVEVDPPNVQIRIEDAQLIVDEVSRSPIEGERKVILLFDAERLRLNDAAANRLLKTLEEPPPARADRARHLGCRPVAPDDPVALPSASTSRSSVPTRSPPRCGPTASPPSGPSSWRASPADGSTGRARSKDASARCARPSSTPPARSTAAGERSRCRPRWSQDALQGAVSDLEAAQVAEAEQLAEQLEAAGYPERTQRAQMRRLDERHKRAHRRARTDALLEGIIALETVYRDALAGPGAERLNLDREVLVLSPRAAAAALDACREARQAIAEFNPNETLLRRASPPAPPTRGRRIPISSRDPRAHPVHSPPRRSSSDGRAAHS